MLPDKQHTPEKVKYDGPELLSLVIQDGLVILISFLYVLSSQIWIQKIQISLEGIRIYLVQRNSQNPLSTIFLAADNVSELFIDGKLVLNGRGFDMEDPSWRKVNITEGIHTIQVKVVNLHLLEMSSEIILQDYYSKFVFLD